MPSDRRRNRRVVVYRAEIPHTSPTEYWQVEYEAVAEALHFACRDLREGRRRPVEIVEDGVVVYDAVSLETACRERAEERSASEETG
jgi:hypothetical protein